MDALRNLTANVPVWQRRLDELSSQIGKRQAELAQLAETQPKCAEGRSLRNKGSTESLKPTDDGPMHTRLDPSVQHPEVKPAPLRQTTEQTAEVDGAADRRQSLPGPLELGTPTARLTQQSTLLPAAGEGFHKRATTKKRTASLASVDGPTEKKKSPRPASVARTMLIVYYDSYVQGFFDDMVRFISSSRNLMRKAKMAAKVAQIKRLAEKESITGDGQGVYDKMAIETLPSLRFMNSRQHGLSGAMRSGFAGARNGPPDIYDELDTALDFVQSTCEHGAHQFLRDANCNEELQKIQQRMAEVLEIASKETERILREEPHLAKETSDQPKPRTQRPVTVSRNLVAQSKDERTPASENTGTKLDMVGLPKKPCHLRPAGLIEVDLPVAGDSVVSAVDSKLEVDSCWPGMPHPSTANTESMLHPPIVAAE